MNHLSLTLDTLTAFVGSIDSYLAKGYKIEEAGTENWTNWVHLEKEEENGAVDAVEVSFFDTKTRTLWAGPRNSELHIMDVVSKNVHKSYSCPQE